MSRESHLELKVGGFVILALAVLTYFVASVSDLSFAQKGTKFEAIFNFANGLRDAAPVRISGVEAGLVKSMDIFVDKNDGNKTKIRVNFWLREGMELATDASLTINQLGLLGEKYIEITPGVSGQLLKEGSVIIGHDPIPMERITQQVSVITTKLESTIEGVNSILSEKNRHSIELILEGLGSVAVSLKEGRGTVGRLMTDDAIFKNIEELTADLKNNPWKLLYRPKK